MDIFFFYCKKNLTYEAIIIIKLSYIFRAKQENSEAYTNVPAKTHVDYFISLSVRRSVVLSVVLWHNFMYGCVREL